MVYLNAHYSVLWGFMGKQGQWYIFSAWPEPAKRLSAPLGQFGQHMGQHGRLRIRGLPQVDKGGGRVGCADERGGGRVFAERAHVARAHALLAGAAAVAALFHGGAHGGKLLLGVGGRVVGQGGLGVVGAPAEEERFFLFSVLTYEC